MLNKKFSRNKNTVSKVAKLSDMGITNTDYTDYKITMFIVLNIQGIGNWSAHWEIWEIVQQNLRNYKNEIIEIKKCNDAFNSGLNIARVLWNDGLVEPKQNSAQESRPDKYKSS